MAGAAALKEGPGSTVARLPVKVCRRSSALEPARADRPRQVQQRGERASALH